MKHAKSLGYLQSTQLAIQAIESHDRRNARMLIERAAELARETGNLNESTHLLKLLAVEPQPRVLAGHVGPVNEVVPLADGSTCVSVGTDGTIRQWNLQTGKQLLKIIAAPERLAETDGTFDNSLHAVAVSSDGKWLLTGHHSLGLYDLHNGTFERYLTSHDTTIESIRFSPDNRLVVSASRYECLKLSSLVSGELAVAKLGQRQTGFNFLDSESIVCGAKVLQGDGHYNALVRVPVTSSGFGEVEELCRTSDPPRSMDISPDGTKVYRSELGKLHAHDLRPFQEEWIAVDGNPLLALACSPNSKVLLGVKDTGQLCTWDLDEEGALERARYCIQAHDGSANDVAFFSNDMFVSCGDDSAVNVWDLNQFQGDAVSHNLKDFAFSADHSWAINHEDRMLMRVILAEPGCEDLMLFDRDIFCLSLAPNERHVALGLNGEVVVFDLSNNQILASYEVSSEGRIVKSIQFSPDGQYLAFAAEHSHFDIRRPLSGELVASLRLPARSSAAHKIAFSPDGTWIAACDEGSLLGFSRVGEWGKLRFVSMFERCNCIEFSLDGKYLYSGHSSGRISQWETATGRLVAETSVRRKVDDIDCFPSGRLIGVASKGGGYSLVDTGTMTWLGRLTFGDIVECELSEDQNLLSVIFTDRVQQFPMQ